MHYSVSHHYIHILPLLNILLLCHQSSKSQLLQNLTQLWLLRAWLHYNLERNQINTLDSIYFIGTTLYLTNLKRIGKGN